tara:strand:+ start:6091 stop:6621 length:531 start_codon:yes stop_codon:yes gene_type:complete
MIDRVKLSQDTLAQTDEQLKTMSMADMSALYCHIVKAPTAPKFSDKNAAIKRIRKMAEEVCANGIERSTESETGTLTQTAPPAKIPMKVGRPKAKAREYIFLTHGENRIEGVAKQAQVIHNNMVHDDWISESEVRIHVEAMKVEGKLATSQSSWRIFQYYRSTLIGRGLLKMRNAQ